MNEHSEWLDSDLTAIIRLMRSAMTEADVPTAKIRQTFVFFKRHVIYGQPLQLEVERISPN